jgi:hypothetical protein
MTPFPRHRATTILGALFTAIVLAGSSRAAQVDVRVQYDDRDLVITATSTIDADADTAWGVLTDYGRYPEFVPGIRSCRIVRRTGFAVTVEQAGTAFLGLAQIPIDVVYEITESPPTELRSFAQVAFIGELDSHYKVMPVGTKVSLEYVGRLAVRPGTPRALEDAAVRQTVSRQFQALSDEIEREWASRFPANGVHGAQTFLDHRGFSRESDAAAPPRAAKGIRCGT